MNVPNRCLFSRFLASSAVTALAVIFSIGGQSLAQETRPPDETAPPAQPPATAPAEQAPPKDLPKAEDLVKASMEALGGKEKFDAIETMSVKGNMAMPMGEIDMDMKSSKDGSFILNQSMAGMGETSMGSDGKVGWMHNPMTGYQLLTDEQTEQVKRQSNMYRMLFNLTEQFDPIETIDQVEFADVECYKVRMTPKSDTDPEQTAYFGVEDKILHGFEMTQDAGPMGEVPVTVRFEDWKTIDGIKVFGKMAIEQMGMTMDMVLSDVEFNKVDKSAFALPDGVKELMAEKSAATAPEGSPTTAPADTPKPE